jgi:hypothetical protein
MTGSLEEALEKVTLHDLEDQHEDEEEEEEKTEIIPFRLFDLPTEIRLKIYDFVLWGSKRKIAARPNGNVGASSKNKPLAPLSQRLSLFLACRRIHDEASQLFYSAQIFRVFPIQDYSRLPTLASLAPSHWPLIRTIELILGSSWTAPPKSWRVTDKLGLTQMQRVRTLKVFVQCDPSQPFFEGFRISKDYYTGFAGDLLHQILEQLPNLLQVEFDAWPSVEKKGPLMSRLLSEVRTAGKKILWGPERGWSDLDDDDDDDDYDYASNDHDRDHGGELTSHQSLDDQRADTILLPPLNA